MNGAHVYLALTHSNGPWSLWRSLCLQQEEIIHLGDALPGMGKSLLPLRWDSFPDEKLRVLEDSHSISLSCSHLPHIFPGQKTSPSHPSKEIWHLWGVGGVGGLESTWIRMEMLRKFTKRLVPVKVMEYMKDYCKRNGLLTLSVFAVVTGCVLGFSLRTLNLSTQVGRDGHHLEARCWI